MNVKALRVFVVLSLFGILCVSVTAQTTAFTYQGSLKDGANAANGSFQMQFKLFDAVSAGTQIGSTIADVPVTVTQGTFSVQLDFGSNALNGANRWLEIAVRHNSGEGYSTLSPRQQIGSSPYSVRTLSAASADTALDSQKLGGVAANQYVQTSDPRLSDARNPLPNSSSYIQNTTAQQAGSNFNVSGNGTVTNLTMNGSAFFTGIAAPAVAPAGQGKFYFDSATGKLKVSESGGAFVNLVGASGISGSGTVNRLPYWSAATTLSDSAIFQLNGNIGIGSTTPVNRLRVSGGAPWTTNNWTGSVELETSSAIAWRANGANNRFGIGATTGGLAFFRTLSDPGTTGNPPFYDFIITDNGNIGVNTLSPTSRLEIAAQDGLKISGFQPFLTLNDTNSSARGIISSGNGDLSFYSNSFIGGTAPLTIKTTSGNVGIGTASPGARLQVNGVNNNSVYGFSTGAGAIGVYGESNAFEGVRGMSHGASSGGVVGYNDSTGIGVFGSSNNGIGMQARSVAGAGVDGGSTTGIGVYGVSGTGYAMFAAGNAGQSRDKGGFVKAMLVVSSTGTIVRCFNGMTNSSLGNCGMNVVRQSQGVYTIDFGFGVQDRFVSLTLAATVNNSTSASYGPSANQIQVDVGSVEPPFTLIVF